MMRKRRSLLVFIRREIWGERQGLIFLLQLCIPLTVVAALLVIWFIVGMRFNDTIDNFRVLEPRVRDVLSTKDQATRVDALKSEMTVRQDSSGSHP